MAQSLYLNKKKADIYDTPITRNIQIGDVSEVGQRKSSFSYTIKLPKTANNMQILDMLGTWGNTSRKPYENVVCDYVQDSVYLVLNGSAVIRETGTDYEVNIIDGVKSLADLLRDKKLVDLPLDDLNHSISTQVYIDSYTKTDGYIYGIADYGTGASANLKVEDQAPSIYTHTLFRRIFESNGLSLQGSFFDENILYLNEVVTPAKGYAVQDTNLTETDKGSADSIQVSDNRVLTVFTKFSRKLTYENSTLVGASIVNGNIQFDVAGTYKIVLYCEYRLYNTPTRISLRLNGIERSLLNLSLSGTEATKTVELNVNAGDVAEVYVTGESFYQFGGETGLSGLDEYIINYTVDTVFNLSLLEGGQVIKPSDYLGDMSQLDFVKDVVNRYGLILQPLQNTDEYRFRRLESVLNDRANAQDWTNRLSAIESENYSSGYSKVNKAKFKYAEAIVIPNNDGEMLIDNENTTEGKVLFSSPFEIPAESNDIEGEPTYLIPVRKDGGLSETPLKVMHINRIDKVITAKSFDEQTGITVGEKVAFLNLDFVSLQYAIGNRYRAFNSLINSYKKVSMLMNLSVVDIFNLDFFKLKYLRQTCRYYYLNSIQFTAGQLAKVEAMEIQEFPTNNPPSQLGEYSFDMNAGTIKIITLANLSAGYEDPEEDKPYKIKLIGGFNPNILLKQNGVTITTETEILVNDLDLVAEEVAGGVYSEQWQLAIADQGSKKYGDETGTISANVLVRDDLPPIAIAGDFITQELYPYGWGYITQVQLNGSYSYGRTSDIINYNWEIVSKPVGSTATITNAGESSPYGTFSALSESANVGRYIVQLTVSDDRGAIATDTTRIDLLESSY